MRTIRSVFLGVVSAAAVTALALHADQLIGVGSGYWSTTLSEDTTGSCVLQVSDAGPSGCALFPAGTGSPMSMAKINTSGAGRCGWSLNSTASLGAMVWDTDSIGGEGGGAINRFQAAGEEWHSRPDWGAMRCYVTTSGLRVCPTGGRIGICSTPRSYFSGEATIYEPCTDGDNCTSGSCVNCVTGNCTDAMRAGVGAYLICESDSGTINFDVHKETVRR